MTATMPQKRDDQRRRVDFLRKTSERLRYLSPTKAWRLIRTGKRDGRLFLAGTKPESQRQESRD